MTIRLLLFDFFLGISVSITRAVAATTFKPRLQTMAGDVFYQATTARMISPALRVMCQWRVMRAAMIAVWRSSVRLWMALMRHRHSDLVALGGTRMFVVR